MFSRLIPGSIFWFGLYLILVPGCVSGPMTIHANSRDAESVMCSADGCTPSIRICSETLADVGTFAQFNQLARNDQYPGQPQP